MSRVILACALLATCVCLTQAEDRWVIDLKSGAGAGLIGVGVEVEWAGFGLWLAGGTTGEAMGAVLGLRWYFSPEAVSRPFAEVIVGQVAIPLQIPFVGLGGGYEWRLTRNVRIGVEAGLAFALIIPLPFFGVFIGWVF